MRRTVIVALLVGILSALVVAVATESRRAGGITAKPTEIDAQLVGTFLQCHDNSTASIHDGHWTHGDPNTGIPPDPKGGNGYYYLNIKACGPLVYGEIYSPDPRSADASRYSWDMDISPGYDHTNELAAGQFSGAGGRIFITNATPGANYRLRVANTGTTVQKDYAELNSGPIGGTDADCGGPGPVRDPNTGATPMEPAPTPGMPANSCAKGGGTLAYNPGGPTPTPTATPTPTPTPGPQPQPISNIPCTVTLNGVQRSGICTGTFTGN